MDEAKVPAVTLHEAADSLEWLRTCLSPQIVEDMDEHERDRLARIARQAARLRELATSGADADDPGMDTDACEVCGKPTNGATDSLGDPVCEDCQRECEE